MSALDKVLRLSGAAPQAVDQDEDIAGELVLAASDALDELRVLLAKAAADDDNDGDEADDNEQTASGKHADHPTYKQMIKRGLKPAEAAAMCAKADRKAAMSGLCEAAIVALAGLDRSAGSWVERTAFDSLSVRLAGDAPGNGKKPYGNVHYADPGYQKDGKKRYPVDTAEHVRAAWSYINHEKNSGEYSSEDLAKVKAAIRSAAKKLGVQISDDGEKVAATMLALAASNAAAMHHGTFTGVHSHAHPVMQTHDHKHYHNGDSEHHSHSHNGEGSGQESGGLDTPSRRY